MISYVSKTGNKSLILFIHGYTGDEDTWRLKGAKSFPEILLSDPKVLQNFDVAHFSYFTMLCDLFAKVGNAMKTIKNVFRISHTKFNTNLGVDEIANLLQGELTYELDNYDNIIIVAHSMGGLVAKRAILKDIEEQTPHKVRLFISLAVPHMGANAANFGKLFSSNFQIENLQPLNELIQIMNDDWKSSPLKPLTKYFHAVHDGVVEKISSAPAGVEKKHIVSVDEDHTTICKPADENDQTFRFVKKILSDCVKNDFYAPDIKFQTLYDDELFNDELFVSKLIIGDIHNSTISDAKELFLNAEYVRKKFNSASDQERFKTLYEKIRRIYMNHYTSFVNGGIPNSGQLLAEVQKNILVEDKSFLDDSVLSILDAIHKQGMLHQIANNENWDVWWTENIGMDFLQKKLEELKNA